MRILHLRPSPGTNLSATRIAVPSLATVGALAQSLTPVGTVVSAAASSGQALSVAFAPDVPAALSQGTLSLIQTATGALPVAVDSNGADPSKHPEAARQGTTITGGRAS